MHNHTIVNLVQIVGQAKEICSPGFDLNYVGSL